MKLSIKLILILGFTLVSIHTNAQSKEDKKIAKTKKANDALLIENKAPLLDGKHQTKVFFATSKNTTTTTDLCNEYTLGDKKDLFFNSVFEDEIQNYFINLATNGGIKFRTYTKYAGGVKKVTAFEKMRQKFEILVDGESVYEGDYMFSTSDYNQLITQPENYIYSDRSIQSWFFANQNLFMKNCKIQIINTYYLPSKYFITEQEKTFFEDKCSFQIKSNIVDYKYNEEKAINYFLHILAEFNYYDVEKSNKSTLTKAFSKYKKENRIKNEKITLLSSLMSQWKDIRYNHVDAIKGRDARAIIFFKDKGTENYRYVAFRIYQDKLYGDKYDVIQLSYATEKSTTGLSFLNQYKKQIGTYLKSHSLDSAL